MPIMENTRNIASVLVEWSMKEYGNVERKKKRLWARLVGIKKAMESPGNNHLLKLEKKIQVELENILNQVELLWYQRSREEWILSGDRNTKFYHAATMTRKQKSIITTLRVDSGEWISEPTTLMNHPEH